MNNIKPVLICGALGFALAGCGSSPNQTVPHQATISSNVLQLAVGTANLYGAQTALNVVTTYRQPSGALNPGASGTLLNTPTLSLPAAIPAGLSAGAAAAAYDASSTVLTAPAVGETTSITSTSQAPLACNVTSFGQSGGVFGLGIEPYNAQAQGDCTPAATNLTGTPFQVAPYPVPLYDTASPTYAAGADPNLFIPWGGPPAFTNGGLTTSTVGSTNYPTGTAGVSEGIDVFAGIRPVAGGAYTLTVAVPVTTTGVTTVTTQTASATLPAALTVLPAAVAPAYVPDAAGDGGGTFALVLPAGATEAYLQITDYGPATASAVSCNGSGTGGGATVGNMTGSPVYYTLEATASGTITLPAALGPGAAPSVCTAAQNTTANGGTATPADQIAIQVIAFDYDLYHASYPLSLGNPSPTIAGAHSSDLSISAATCQTGPVGAGSSCTATLPLLKARGGGTRT